MAALLLEIPRFGAKNAVTIIVLLYSPFVEHPGNDVGVRNSRRLTGLTPSCDFMCVMSGLFRPLRGGALAAVLACSGCSETTDAAGGNDQDGGHTGSSGGGPSSGGSNAAGGSTSSGGSAANGGASKGGSPGTGGSNAAGSGGTAGTGGASGSSAGGAGGAAGPTKSAGCGIPNPPSGILSFRVENQDAEYQLSLPSNYDPTTAYPLGFGFHGRNRTGPNCHDGDCAGFQSVMGDHAVLVYMTALGGALGWEGTGEREINVQFFEELVAHVKANYCVDEQRIFVAGTSSGAHFVNVLGCRFGDWLLATAPVAGYLPERNCVGQIPALVIHGVSDSSFSAGVEARDFYVGRNGCDGVADPPLAPAHDSVVANRESHQCVSYQGCDPRKPVTWCEHSEGGYDGSTHGWPKFGGQQIWDFVQSL
jgi:polyhydroxybutyrate depolymerase